MKSTVLGRVWEVQPLKELPVSRRYSLSYRQRRCGTGETSQE